MGEPRPKATPPPIPDAAKRRGPPPIPKAALEESIDIDVSEFEALQEKKGPPPIPEGIRSEALRQVEALQIKPDDADVIENFGDRRAPMRVSWEMRKKRSRAEGERGEDAVLSVPGRNGKGVADGLGGQGKPGSGAEASAAAQKLLPHTLSNAQIDVERSFIEETQQTLIEDYLRSQTELTPRGEQRKDEIKKRAEEFEAYSSEIQKTVLTMHRGTRALSAEIAKDGNGGNTTMTYGETVIVKTSEGLKVYEVIVQIGDSSAVRVTKDGKAADRVTKEQSTVDQLVAEGIIDRKFADDPKKWDETFVAYGQEMTVNGVKHGMFQALGQVDRQGRPIEVHPVITVIERTPGDKFLYVTDGITDVQTKETGAYDEAQAAGYLAGPDSAAGIERMVADSVAAKKKDDDIAAVVAEFPRVAL